MTLTPSPFCSFEKNLSVLTMRSNRLQCVPGVIGDLASLESVCFSQNMITVFPFEKLEKLRKLRDLCLHGNRLDDREILESWRSRLAERECMLRAEENRVPLPRRGAVCDGVFKVWHYDVLWIHDGGESVTTWIGEVASKLLQRNQLSSKVNSSITTVGFSVSVHWINRWFKQNMQSMLRSSSPRQMSLVDL